MSAPLPGQTVLIPLSDRAGDVAEVRALLDRRRDILPRTDAVRADPLAVLGDAVLVDVSVRGRVVLPGAWVEPEVFSRGEPGARHRVSARDLRMPAVVLGDGAFAALAWGETVWPLPFDDSVQVPSEARPSAHPLSRLRRLVLIADDRHDEVGLTLWRAADFVVPWHDVRLLPRARWWFEMAQIPPGTRYADAARQQGMPVDRLLPERN